MSQKTHASGLVYAAWGQRVGAELLDQLFVTIPLGIVMAIMDVPRGAASIIFSLVIFLYSWILDSEPGGQTWGKRLLHIRVVDDETADVISRTQGASRAGVVAGLTLLGNLSVGDESSFAFTLNILALLDSLWPLWDRKSQTWHDKAARSVVVRVED